MHVAALHDRDERRRLFFLELLFPNCFLGPWLLADVDDGILRIVHPALAVARVGDPAYNCAFSRRDFVDVIGDTVKFLCANDKVEVGQILEQRSALGLRHAAQKAKDDVRPLLCHATHHAHFAERLLVGHIAHAAGIEQHDICVRFVLHPLVTAGNE